MWWSSLESWAFYVVVISREPSLLCGGHLSRAEPFMWWSSLESWAFYFRETNCRNNSCRNRHGIIGYTHQIPWIYKRNVSCIDCPVLLTCPCLLSLSAAPTSHSTKYVKPACNTGLEYYCWCHYCIECNDLSVHVICPAIERPSITDLCATLNDVLIFFFLKGWSKLYSYFLVYKTLFHFCSVSHS
jgi:hypothetical protein